MAKLACIMVALGLFVAPSVAKADFVLEGSVGVPYNVKEPRGRAPTNVMLAPGWGLGEMLRAELGIVGDLGDVEGAEFDLQIRPMLVIDPPLLPLYGRIIVGVTNLLSDADTEIAYGGALGLGFSLAGLGAFVEAGLVPIGGADVILLEGRAGVYISFD